MGAPRLRGRRRPPPFPLGARLLQVGRPLVVGEGAAASSVARAGRSEGGGWPKLRRVRVGVEGEDGHRAAPEKDADDVASSALLFCGVRPGPLTTQTPNGRYLAANPRSHWPKTDAPPLPPPSCRYPRLLSPFS